MQLHIKFTIFDLLYVIAYNLAIHEITGRICKAKKKGS
jgi:hypothetical protein